MGKILIRIGEIKKILESSVYGFPYHVGAEIVSCVGIIHFHIGLTPVRGYGRNRHYLARQEIFYLVSCFFHPCYDLMTKCKICPFRTSLPDGMDIGSTGGDQHRLEKNPMFIQKNRCHLFNIFYFSFSF